MDIHSELSEPITPRQIFENMHYWKHEDSGYHTSFTPESLECSSLSSNLSSTLFKRKINVVGQLQLDCFDLTKDVAFGSTLNCSSGIIRSNGDYKESPQNRRGTKRVFQEEADSIDVNSSIPTPTSMISGGLRKLRFNESHIFNSSFTSSYATSDIYNINENLPSPYPTTPIKKNCRNSCKLSSPLNPKRPVKKLNFVIHSLSCDSQALQPATKFAKQESEIKKYSFKPNQKVDIIKLLYNSKMMPPIMKIFNYLSPEDIFNFKLVSPFWQSIWNDVSIKSKKKEYLSFLANVKENQENKISTPKNNNTNLIRPLMERHNVCYPKQMTSSKSPPGTPRTIRFKRYTKTASLDSRKQLSCVRCCLPAKVTEETSGEEWVECTSETCAYQFCKFCKCERHPDKKCFQYDLDGPSPSKRKKSTCVVGTKKSRKNLRRLLS